MPRGDNAPKTGQQGWQKTQPKPAAVPKPSDIKPLPFSMKEDSSTAESPDWGSMRRVLLEKRYQGIGSAAVPPGGNDGNRKKFFEPRKVDPYLNGRSVKEFQVQTRSWDHKSVPAEYNRVGTVNPITTISHETPAPKERRTKFSGIRTNLRRTAVVLAGLSIAVGALSACGSSDSPGEEEAPQTVSKNQKGSNPNVRTFYVERPDGSKVLCVWASSYQQGGLSCDWNTIAIP